MILKRIVITLCEACLKGEGEECHTPGCALFLHNSPGFEIMPEAYDVLSQWKAMEDWK